MSFCAPSFGEYFAISVLSLGFTNWTAQTVIGIPSTRFTDHAFQPLVAVPRPMFLGSAHETTAVSIDVIATGLFNMLIF